ncbi:MAG: ABC transporter permease subunit [Pirellulales bacterium]
MHHLAILGVSTIWVKPLWLLGVGAALGLTVALLITGLIWIVSRRTATWMIGTMRDGPLLPVVYLIVALAGFVLLTSPSMEVSRLWNSVRRVMAVGTIQMAVEVPAEKTDQPIELALRADELTECIIRAEQDVTITTKPGVDPLADLITVEGGEPYLWNTHSGLRPPFRSMVDRLYITNASDVSTNVEISVTTDVEFPEVYVVPATAAAVCGLLLVYLLTHALFRKLSTIADATAKETTLQPIYYLVLVVGGFALLAFIYVPYNTLGEDVKMLKDSGMTLILVLSMMVALWTASVSIAEELEGRTALTLLSKPISRQQFIIGKFLGIIWSVVVLFILLGFLFLVTVSYKIVYDAKELASTDPSWRICYREMISTVPGLLLAWMETVVLTAISVAVSTRLPMLPNLIICCSVYVLGHLGPMIVNSGAGKFEIVGFIGRLIATLLPVLDDFNIQAAIAAGAAVPLPYLGWAFAYCVLYSTIALLLALAMFEDRDLA